MENKLSSDIALLIYHKVFIQKLKVCNEIKANKNKAINRGFRNNCPFHVSTHTCTLYLTTEVAACQLEPATAWSS